MRIIVNGAAGGGRAAKAALPFIDQLRANGIVEVVTTERPGHATALARAAVQDGVEAIVAVGGDGTVFEVINGILPHTAGAAPRLGLVPLGTGNSFVRDLDLADADAACRAIVAGRTRSVDAVRFLHNEGEVHYVNLMSLGFSARAGALTNRRYKPLGTAGYILAVLHSLIQLRPERFAHVCDDGHPERDPVTLVSFSNSRYTGGDMMMAPQADIADGQLDVIRIGIMGRMRFLSSFPRIFAGTHPEMAEVTTDRARRVTFDISAPVDVMVDGEILKVVPRSLEVVPGALEVFA